MAEYNKQRLYWIKLTDRLMTSDTVDFLMSQKDGANYVVLYQMLCLKTINNNGELARTLGEIIVPYDEDKIQRDMKWFSIDTIRVAMGLYRKLGLIYEQSNGILRISNFEQMVGSQTISAFKKQLQIENRGGKKVENFPPDKEKDIKIKDKEIIKEKEDKEKESIDSSLQRFLDKHNVIIDSYNGNINDINFEAVSKAFDESSWLRKNISSLSKVCMIYPKIIAGYYKDYEEVEEEVILAQEEWFKFEGIFNELKSNASNFDSMRDDYDKYVAKQEKVLSALSEDAIAYFGGYQGIRRMFGYQSLENEKARFMRDFEKYCIKRKKKK